VVFLLSLYFLIGWTYLAGYGRQGAVSAFWCGACLSYVTGYFFVLYQSI